MTISGNLLRSLLANYAFAYFTRNQGYFSNTILSFVSRYTFLPFKCNRNESLKIFTCICAYCLVGITTFTGYMCLFRYNLFMNYNGRNHDGVIGVAWLKSVCKARRVSLVEDTQVYFITTSVAAHELGHR